MKQPEKFENQTYQDYVYWEGRWEIINGVPYQLPSGNSPVHQKIAMNIGVHISAYAKINGYRAFFVPIDVRLSPENDETPKTVIQPDVMVICDPVRLDNVGLKGAPDVVVEILAPETALRDRGEKFNLYQAYGSAEYWIVDPAHQTVEVYSFNGGALEKRTVVGIEDILYSDFLKDFSIKVNDIFEDIMD